jgi:hypothetical protein
MWNENARRHLLAILAGIARIRNWSFLAAFLSLGLTPAAHATTITNGGFDTDLTGWTTSGPINSSFAAILSGAGRAALIGFTGLGVGTFSQNFTLADGGVVDYSFLAARSESACGCNDVPLTFAVRIDGNILSTALPNFDPAGSGGSFNITTLTSYSGSLFLSAGAHVLAFEFSRGETSFGRAAYFVLDGVNVSESASPPLSETPVPAALPLFVGGLGLFGFLVMRERKTANAL